MKALCDGKWSLVTSFPILLPSAVLCFVCFSCMASFWKHTRCIATFVLSETLCPLLSFWLSSSLCQGWLKGRFLRAVYHEHLKISTLHPQKLDFHHFGDLARLWRGPACFGEVFLTAPLPAGPPGSNGDMHVEDGPLALLLMSSEMLDIYFLLCLNVWKPDGHAWMVF